MIRTDEQITHDVWSAIKGTALERSITGQVKKDLRPANSQKEDVVVKVLSSTANQEQRAFVNVNIYVADIFGAGQYEKNRDRCSELGSIAAEMLKSKNSGAFRWDLDSMHTVPQPETNEHIVNLKIIYRYLNKN